MTIKRFYKKNTKVWVKVYDSQNDEWSHPERFRLLSGVVTSECVLHDLVTVYIQSEDMWRCTNICNIICNE